MKGREGQERKGKWGKEKEEGGRDEETHVHMEAGRP